MNLRRIFIALLIALNLMPMIAAANVSVTGGLTRERQAAIGSEYEGTVEIKNNGQKPRSVKVFQTDYLFFANGKNIYGEPGNAGRSNADWIYFSPKRITIPAGGTGLVHYRVKVPDRSTITGTYWSILMVQGIGEGSAESHDFNKKDGEVALFQILRYGIQIVTNIGNTGEKKIRFANTKLLKKEGKRVLKVDLENTGERWMRPRLWVELYDDNGKLAGSHEGGSLRIYPGTSVRYTVELSPVPPGTYKALVITDSGGNDLFGATYKLIIE